MLIGRDRWARSMAARYPAMIPAASRRRTRSRLARADNPTFAASSCMVERPLRCRSASILTSIRSNAGGRFVAIVVSITATGVRYDRGSESRPLLGHLIRHRYDIIQPEPAAIGID